MVCSREDATHKEHAEYRTDETGEVERPSPSDNIDQQSKTEGTDRQTSIGTRPDNTLLAFGYIHLLAVDQWEISRSKGKGTYKIALAINPTP